MKIELTRLTFNEHIQLVLARTPIYWDSHKIIIQSALNSLYTGVLYSEFKSFRSRYRTSFDLEKSWWNDYRNIQSAKEFNNCPATDYPDVQMWAIKIIKLLSL